MRHVQIARLTLAITGLFAAAAVLFAATRPDIAPMEEVAAENQVASEGQLLFEAQCAGCHGTSDIGNWAARHPDRDQRVAWLNEFLQRHFPPGEQERPLIIEYIENSIASSERG
jgi:mono/diheme cytochrome c family protein